MFTCSDLFLSSHNSNHFICTGRDFLTAHGADYNRNSEKIQKLALKND